MSYDVKLFVPVPGAGTPEEQFERLMDEAERTVRPIPLPPDEVQRIEAVMAEVRALDPTVSITELRDGTHLKGFVVSDSETLPYIEIGATDGALAWSLVSEPANLYRSLMQMTALAARHGYLAFDRQQGAIIKPADDFASFMPQFANQWQTPEDFTRWLAAQTGTPAAAVTSAGQAGKSPNFLAWVIVAGVVVWGAYKLHKAGYF